MLGLDTNTRSNLLACVSRPDHRTVVLLAGVHALTRAQMIALQLDDIDSRARTMTIAGTHRPLARLLVDTIDDWLTQRHQRWPASANPHLLVSYKSVYSLEPVSTAYITGIFKTLPTTAAGLRADRLLDEAHANGGDPLRLARLFNVSPDTAVRYCTQDAIDTPPSS